MVTDDNGFGDAIMHALAVVVDEELHETETGFESRGAIAEGAFDGLPEGNPGMGEGDDPDAKEPLAESSSIGEPDAEAGIDDEVEQVSQLVKVEADGDVNGLAFSAEFKVLAQHFNGDEDQKDDDQVDEKSSQALPERG